MTTKSKLTLTQSANDAAYLKLYCPSARVYLYMSQYILRAYICI